MKYDNHIKQQTYIGPFPFRIWISERPEGEQVLQLQNEVGLWREIAGEVSYRLNRAELEIWKWIVIESLMVSLYIWG